MKSIEAILDQIWRYLLLEDSTNSEVLLSKINHELKLQPEINFKNKSLTPLFLDIRTEIEFQKNRSNSTDKISWKKEQVSHYTLSIPHMLYDESFQYYKWLGKNFSGYGSIIELGCWMGATTSCIAEGLSENINGVTTKVNVFDSFLWINEFLSYGNLISSDITSLNNGENFIHIFEKYTNKYKNFIEVTQCFLNVDNTESAILPSLEWSNSPVEILIMDFCADRLENEKVWEIFKPFFIPNKTILVYNQFGNFDAIELREFLRKHSNQIVPIHKPNSSIKSFLFVN